MIEGIEMHDTPFDRIVVPKIKKVFKFIGKVILGLIGLDVILNIISFTFTSTTHFLITAGIAAYIYIVLFKIKNKRLRSNIIAITVLPFAFFLAAFVLMIVQFFPFLFKSLDNPILAGQKVTLRDIYYELSKLGD